MRRLRSRGRVRSWGMKMKEYRPEVIVRFL